MKYCKGLVSVVIVTFNQRECLKRCIFSLLSQGYSHLEIIIVNNGREGDLENLKLELSSLKVINNKENLFFTQAQNHGIKASSGEFILCLNDDVILEDNFIDELVKAIRLDERIGMISGKILRMDKVTIDSTGLFLGKSRKPVERGFNQKDIGQYNKEGDIFGVSGAAAFYRRAMLEDIKDENGYFDQRYEMFYEDLDLAWRANKKGWRGYYTPKAIAYHKRGASAKTFFPGPRFLKKYKFVYLNNNLKIRLIKNRYLTIIKNDSFWGIIFNLPFILAYEIKLYIYIILFSPKLFKQIFKGLLNRC
jgi:GT2 family glycosyltransferase